MYSLIQQKIYCPDFVTLCIMTRFIKFINSNGWFLFWFDIVTWIFSPGSILSPGNCHLHIVTWFILSPAYCHLVLFYHLEIVTWFYIVTWKLSPGSILSPGNCQLVLYCHLEIVTCILSPGSILSPGNCHLVLFCHL